MRRALFLIAVCAAAASLLLSAPAGGIDLGTFNKVLQHSDAIIKSGKALRKGFTELTAEEEYYIGRSVAARLLGNFKPSPDSGRNTYINTVGQLLAAYSSRPETFGGYHFQLIESDEINAFAAPGGLILITTGLYRSLENEEQLAAVLAHEVSHVVLKHGLSAIKSSRLTEAFTIIGTEVAQERSPAEVAQLTSVFDGTLDDIVNKLVVSGYSRGQEEEADREALRILYKAGYNPQGLLEFLKVLMEGEEKGKGKGFYSTHPPTEKRLKKAEGSLKDEKLFSETDSVRTSRFAAHKL